jgi:hypothetical protein
VSAAIGRDVNRRSPNRLLPTTVSSLARGGVSARTRHVERHSHAAAGGRLWNRLEAQDVVRHARPAIPEWVARVVEDGCFVIGFAGLPTLQHRATEFRADFVRERVAILVLG